MDTDAGSLALDLYAGLMSLWELDDRRGGSLQRRGERHGFCHQPRFAVALLQAVVADEEQAVDRQPRRNRVGIPATDDGDPQQVTAELAEDRN